jgi:HlyD family secretion protein
MSSINNISVTEKVDKGFIKTLKRMRKMKKRTKIIIGIILIIILVSGYFIFKPQKPTYEWTTVEKGQVTEEVSINGTVEAIDEIDLRFKTSGTIEKILVNVGDKVKKDAALARLNTGEVYSQYLQSQASYNQARAKLDQLLAGATTEEIKVAEHIVDNAKISLDDANAKAENDLNQDYNSALSYLVSSSSKCNKAITDMKDIEKTYFSDSSAISREFVGKRELAEESFSGTSGGIDGAQELVEAALDDPTQENIDSALSSLWTALQKTINLLDYAKTATSEPTFIGKVSSTDKTTITADAAETTTAFINISSSQTEIANQKITNQININSAESTLKRAELDLEELKAPPRDVDTAVYQADVERYKANLEEYGQKLQDASIIAPFDGTVARIDGKIGEVITAGAKTTIALLSPSGFQIKADIPETDIGDVTLDDPVTIVIDALPEENFEGQILEIDPAETLVDGVVYYRVKILFVNPSIKLRSGMSGDATIQTAKKGDVLHVPQRAVITKNGDKIVRVLDGEEIIETKVITGLRGSEGEIEIISGIKEGDKVITYLKKT